jgi:hypothetical protein
LGYTKRSEHPILFRCIREFYENAGEMVPSNYMIMIRKDHTCEEERPSFEITMFLNNKPYKIEQEVIIYHNFNTLENGIAENEFLHE